MPSTSDAQPDHTSAGRPSTPGEHSDEIPLEDEYTDHLTWAQVRRPFAAIVAGLVALALAFLAGTWTASPRTYPTTDSIEAGFARDMTAHHAQAVSMSLTMLGKSPSPQVRTLAYDVATTQENQRGQMMAWLTTWGVPQAVSGQRMTWMRRTGHQHAGLAKGQMLLPDGRMPGMATQAQLHKLSTLTGKQAEILYLQLMIVHHTAGVEMARAVEGTSRNGEVTRLAKSMVAGQTSELTTMRHLLAAEDRKSVV